MFPRLAAIIVLGFIAWGIMLPSPFRLLDDHVSILDNPLIKSTKNIAEIFREGYFHDQSYYRPLINLSFLGEFQVYHYKSFFYNLDNLILHILNALLVVLLVTKLTNNASIGFWTGLLFVIHPVQWEAVCNIPGRAILLSAFFVLSSFILFLEYYKNRNWPFLLLLLVTFFLGLLCKESAGVLPAVIIVYCWADKTKAWASNIKCLWPFLVGIAVYVFLRQFFGITKINHPFHQQTMVLGFVTFLRSVITDLRLMVFPLGLHYDRCQPLMGSLIEPHALLTMFFWAAVAVILVISYRRINAFIIFLILWFAIEMLPVSQLVASIEVGKGYISTAEHFLYLACIPVLIGLVMFFHWLYELNLKSSFLKPVLLKILAGGFILFLLLMSVGQSIYASNEFSMVKRSLTLEPHNPRLQEIMGMLSIYRKDFSDAELHFRAAIKEEPTNPEYQLSLGTALCQQGKWIDGLAQYVVFDPNNDNPLIERQKKLTMTYILDAISQGKTVDARGWLTMGDYYAQTGQKAQAIDAFLKSVSLNPQQADAWLNLGSLYEFEANWPEARAAYKNLLNIQDLTVFQRDFASKHLAEIVDR